MNAFRSFAGMVLLAVLVCWHSPALAADPPAYATITTRGGSIMFGLIVRETPEKITLHSIRTQKEYDFVKSEAVSIRRGATEDGVFDEEELPYALAWKLGTLPPIDENGSPRAGRLALIPFVAAAEVKRDGLAIYQANLSTILVQRKINVIDAGLVQKAMIEAATNDPLTPPVLEASKRVKADWALTGDVVAKGNGRELHYRLLDVNAGVTIVAGVKQLPLPQAASTVPPPAPVEKKPEPQKIVIPDLSGSWTLETQSANRVKIPATLAEVEKNKYHLTAGGVYGGDYELRGDKLFMTKSNPDVTVKEQLIWRVTDADKLMLISSRWAGTPMTRKKSPETDEKREPEKKP